MATRMQQRRGTAAEWTTVNPVLAAGEIGYETDTGKFKIGDGTNTWDSLYTYGSIDSILDAPPETLDTLNELAAAINDDPDFYNSITTSITDAVAQLNTSIGTNRTESDAYTDSLVAAEAAARITYTDDAVSAAIDQEVTDRDAAIATAVQAEASARSTAISSAIAVESGNRDTAIQESESDITDAYTAADSAVSSALTTAYTNADTALSTALTTAYEAYADAAESDAITSAGTYTDTTVSTHNSATTNVHGIADTADLATSSDVSAAQTAAQNYADGLAVNYDAVGSAASAQTAAQSFATTAVDNHSADTTDVHGIADTSLLVTTAGATFLGKLTLDGDPTQALHAATKQYVDSAQAGLSTKPQVVAASTANVSGTYDNGTDGVGATLNLGQFATLDIDGVTSWSLLDGILLKDQTNAAENGRWVVDQIGNATDTDWILRRCSLCDTADEIPGAYIFVIDGVTNEQTGWVLHVDDPATFTVGTDNISAYQFAGAGSVTAGTNMVVSGNEVSLSSDPTLADATITTLDITNLVFADGTQTKAGVPSITPIAEKTASYTLSSATERDTIIEVNSASATTLTIPEDATLNFPVGTTLDIIQTGTGQVTIAGTGSAVVNGTPGTKLRTQWSSVTLLKRAANSWLVFGDTAA